jgi:DNA-directed RNA polymerase specialized sigma24 family protein
MEQLEKYLLALVLLGLDARREDSEPSNPAVLLARAGFTHPEIAKLLNKKAGAVQKAVERARKKGGRTKK